MENDTLLYAYMAGLIDGEGTISIKSQAKDRPFYGYISMANTNYELIKIFEERFGGKVRKRNFLDNKKNLNKNWKPCFEWQLACNKAGKAITLLLPFIRAKKRQGVLVMRLLKLKKKYNRSYCRWHPEIKKRRDEVYALLKNECKKLNKRGL